MTRDISAIPHSSLNAFLFAAVGTEANGMTLSVLSVLARFDLDPWQEAGRLAKLSPAKAIEAVASRIRALPASPWSLADAVPIATRLVALLPSGAVKPGRVRATRGSGSGVRPAGRGGLVPTGRQWFGLAVLAGVVFAGLAMGFVTSLPG